MTLRNFSGAALVTRVFVRGGARRPGRTRRDPVYTEEMDDPGEAGLELHLNYAIKGAREAQLRRQKPATTCCR